MLKDFKAFVLRGNVVDLAVGIVIGAAFGALVASFVENILSPLVAIPGSSVSRFADYHFTVGGGDFRYGQVITDVVTFVLVAAAVFFLVVRPVNALMNRHKTEPDVQSPTKQCAECLSSIPRDARRCAYCTSEQPA
jgi:large conductance mechanosensitive channel